MPVPTLSAARLGTAISTHHILLGYNYHWYYSRTVFESYSVRVELSSHDKAKVGSLDSTSVQQETLFNGSGNAAPGWVGRQNGMQPRIK